jgi:hypothetical protein
MCQAAMTAFDKVDAARMIFPPDCLGGISESQSEPASKTIETEFSNLSWNLLQLSH